MYTAIYEAHRGFAMLGVALTVVWAALALLPALTGRPVSRLWRPAYILAMATTGLSGITGLVVLWLGNWLSFVFPGLGLAAVALHGVAGVRGRKALAAGAGGALKAALAVQIVTLVVVYALMTLRPF